jgi:hypothetical protein
MISKEGKYDAEVAVHASRHEHGLGALRDWLYIRRDEINTNWPNIVGDELSTLQGEAKMVARLIKLIEQGPAIKPERSKTS